MCEGMMIFTKEEKLFLSRYMPVRNKDQLVYDLWIIRDAIQHPDTIAVIDEIVEKLEVLTEQGFRLEMQSMYATEKR